jgi:hypothetical protein
MSPDQWCQKIYKTARSYFYERISAFPLYFLNKISFMFARPQVDFFAVPHPNSPFNFNSLKNTKLGKYFTKKNVFTMVLPDYRNLKIAETSCQALASICQKEDIG